MGGFYPGPLAVYPRRLLPLPTTARVNKVQCGSTRLPGTNGGKGSRCGWQMCRSQAVPAAVCDSACGGPVVHARALRVAFTGGFLQAQDLDCEIKKKVPRLGDRARLWESFLDRISTFCSFEDSCGNLHLFRPPLTRLSPGHVPPRKPRVTCPISCSRWSGMLIGACKSGILRDFSFFSGPTPSGPGCIAAGMGRR